MVQSTRTTNDVVLQLLTGGIPEPTGAGLGAAQTAQIGGKTVVLGGTSLLVDGDSDATAAASVTENLVVGSAVIVTSHIAVTSTTAATTNVGNTGGHKESNKNAIIGGTLGISVVVTSFLIAFIVIRRRRRRSSQYHLWNRRAPGELSIISAGNTAVVHFAPVEPFVSSSRPILDEKGEEGAPGQFARAEQDDTRSSTLGPPPTEDRDSETLPAYRSVAS